MLFPHQWLLATALAATLVNGHGYMTEPACKFTASAGDPTQFIATIEASASGFSGSFNGAPADNAAAFAKAFKSSSYKSLKAFIDAKAKVSVSGATLTCGSCDPKQTGQPLPATVEWSHSDSEGFTPSHAGPCEVWCDDKQAFHDDDCAANYKMVPAELPYEKASCSGASKLTFYWMAMHTPTWQVYVNCAPLSGGSTASNSTATSTDAPSTSTTDAPSTSTTDAPSTSTTDAPSTSTTDGPSTSTTESPTATSASQTAISPSTTTTPTTSAPSTTTSTTSAPTTTSGVESDCGSLDVAGSESDCDSYDVAGSESECGSYDVAGSESDCGSYDVAGGSSDSSQVYSDSKTNIDFNTIQGTTTVGTVSPK